MYAPFTTNLHAELANIIRYDVAIACLTENWLSELKADSDIEICTTVRVERDKTKQRKVSILVFACRSVKGGPPTSV